MDLIAYWIMSLKRIKYYWHFSIFKSFIDLTKYILFSRKSDVIFFYPQHFNRSKEGDNPYFRPIVNLCKEIQLDVLLIEEPDLSSTCYPRDSKALKFDLITVVEILTRKLLFKIHPSYSQETIDGYVAKIFSIITFNKFKVKCIFTISNSNIRFLSSINNSVNIYDLQHGIIYSGHSGYFNKKGELHNVLKRPNVKILIWGDLYKNNINQFPGSVKCEDKFIVVGYPLYKRIEMNELFAEKKILISLQITSDISKEISYGILEMLEEFASEAISKGYYLILKHHPRFNNEVDLNPLMEKFNGNIEISTETIDSLSKIIKLQVTWGSTTALEYAAYGIPTYFLRDDRFDWATEIFYGQYKYPLYNNMSASEVLERIDSDALYHEDRAIIKEWYESAYSPFNNELMVKILKGEINGK